MNFVFFFVKKSGISVFLVSVENGAGVNKMTTITYGRLHPFLSQDESRNVGWNCRDMEDDLQELLHMREKPASHDGLKQTSQKAFQIHAFKRFVR